MKAKINKSLYLSFLIILLSSSISFSFYPAQVRNISNREYYSEVKELIDNSKESIHMVMYVFTLNRNNKNQVYNLASSLVEAKKRGVDVYVVLDRSINFVTGVIDEKNAAAYRYLAENGVKVFYDDLYTYSHNKTLVIDKKLVVAGSTNWSQAALMTNNETGLLIKSPELAKTILEDLGNIKLDLAELLRPFEEDDALAISIDFFQGKDLAGRMITKSDERAFDLYLLILSLAGKESVIEFDFDLFAQKLGLDEAMSKEAYRRQLIKTLRKLKKQYKLIDVEFRHAKNAVVSLLDLKDPSEKYKYPEENFFLLPIEYFDYGWYRKFSFSGKFCFFINCFMYERGESRYWSLSREDIGRLFNLSKYTVSRGMDELRRLDIIDIEYSSVSTDYESRSPARTEFLGLYSIEKHEKEILLLKEKYGEFSFDRARDFAQVVCKENDLSAIEEIIELTEEYGQEKIKKSYEILSSRAPDNPYKTFRYAVGLIKALDDEIQE